MADKMYVSYTPPLAACSAGASSMLGKPCTCGEADARTRTGDPFITRKVLAPNASPHQGARGRSLIAIRSGPQSGPAALADPPETSVLYVSYTPRAPRRGFTERFTASVQHARARARATSCPTAAPARLGLAPVRPPGCPPGTGRARPSSTPNRRLIAPRHDRRRSAMRHHPRPRGAAAPSLLDVINQAADRVAELNGTSPLPVVTPLELAPADPGFDVLGRHISPQQTRAWHLGRTP